MTVLDDIFEILVGQKIYTDGAWHVYDEHGQEISDEQGILWRGNPGALLMWPRKPVLQQLDAVGPDDIFVRIPREGRIARQESEWETFVPADVRAQQRLDEDEILLVMIARAVTSGALNQWH